MNPLVPSGVNLMIAGQEAKPELIIKVNFRIDVFLSRRGSYVAAN